MKRNFTKLLLPALVFLFTFVFQTTKAQWNTNTSVNLQISGLPTADMQAVSTTDNKLWVAFYHENAGNYDMRAQLFDADGNKLLGPDGVLVSNQTSGSATFVFNVCIDASNNLIVAMQDQRSGGMQAYVYKISQTGTHLWSNTGVLLGAGLAPYPAGLSNGEVVVTWNSDISNTLSLQKISAAGTLVWTNPVSILVGTSTTTRGQIVANLNNKFTMVYQKNAGGISTNLYAQLFDNSGTALYAPLQICNQTTAGYRYYSIAAEGDTTYFGYYSSTGLRFNSFLQRINPNGTIPWGMNGSAFNTSTSGSDYYQMTTNINLTPGSPYAWSVCTFSDPNQVHYGIYMQKFLKSTGARQFTDQGKAVYPVGSINNQHAGNLQLYNDQPLFMSYDDNYKLYVTKLDGNGNFVWSYNRTEISSTTAGAGNPKGRYDFCRVGPDRFAGIWTEDRGTADLGYVQGISQNGLFGIDVTTQGAVPAVINTGNGSLQLLATVFPSYASQQANWSITPGTGMANISASGQVTAIADGTVWAKAIAVQDNTVKDSLLITISNQVPVAPDVITLPADNLEWFSATLNGSVDANYFNSTSSFEWGLTNAYGNTVSASPSVVTGGSATPVFAELTGLTHSTTYHYRCKGVNIAGTSYGQDLTFTTDCYLSGSIGPITGISTLCVNTNSVVYSIPAFAGATGYTWTVPAGATIVSGNNTNSITVDFSASAQTGNITVFATDGACYSATSAPYTVIVNATPVIPGNISGMQIVCEGDQGLVYSVTAVPGASSYSWTVPPGAVIVAGTTTNSITVNYPVGSLPGTITVSASNECGVGMPSNPLPIDIAPLPGTPGLITGPVQLCAGNSNVTYSVQAVTNGFDYVWSVPVETTIVSGGNTNQITVQFLSALTGNISVYATNGNCLGQTSPQLLITVNPITSTPDITRHGDTLVSSAGSGNQWYLDGAIIPGATGTKHIAVYTGVYSVIVTLNGCSSAPSDGILVIPVSVSEHSVANTFEIYPNPNNGQFEIKFEMVENSEYILEIFDQTGKSILKEEKIFSIEKNTKQINLKNTPPGSYLFVLRSGDSIVSKKIFIVK